MTQRCKDGECSFFSKKRSRAICLALSKKAPRIDSIDEKNSKKYNNTILFMIYFFLFVIYLFLLYEYYMSFFYYIKVSLK